MENAIKIFPGKTLKKLSGAENHKGSVIKFTFTLTKHATLQTGFL